MDSGLFEGGFTRIPNRVFAAVMRAKFNGTQRAIIDCVWRQTYGYGRREYRLSESFIAKATGAPQRNVRRELTALIRSYVLITVKEPTSRTSRVIAFNDDDSDWLIGTRKSGPRDEDGEKEFSSDEVTEKISHPGG